MVDTRIGHTLRQMNRFNFLLLALGCAHCGGSVAADPSATADTGAPASDTGTVVVDAPAPEFAETASCEAIKSSCTTDPAVLVRGHAEGLAFLDGARVEFAVRYIKEEGRGLDVPHGVALGRTFVKDGKFETCVCVPHGANMYPQIAAVVYRPHTTSLTSKDVIRATFSQRYATLGDENVGYALNAVPGELQKEAAVAAMADRTATVVLSGLGAEEHVTAGLIADERPLAAQVSGGAATGGKAEITWTMPGHAWSSERIAFFVDRNKNGKCDTDGSDRGGFAPYAAAATFDGKWLEGAALAAVCNSIQAGFPRE